MSSLLRLYVRPSRDHRLTAPDRSRGGSKDFRVTPGHVLPRVHFDEMGKAISMRRVASQEFPCDVGALGRVRAFAGETLSAWSVPPDDVILVVGELAANAIVHARSAFEVSLREHHGGIVAEVTDNSEHVPKVGRPDDEGVGGRGLRIVEGIARAWGFHAGVSWRKVVWAEIPLAGRPRMEVLPARLLGNIRPIR